MCGGNHYTNCEHIPRGYCGPNAFVYQIYTRYYRYNSYYGPNYIDIRLCPKCNKEFLEALVE